MPFEKIKNWLKRSDASASSVEQTTTKSTPAPKADPLSISYVQEWINIQARSGFVDFDTVFEDLKEIIEDEGLNYNSGWQTKMEEALSQQKLREAKFPKITPNDRLTTAFIEMNAQGLIALENAGYTQSDGWDDLRELFFERGEKAEGGVFYHGQDVERGITGAGLNIRFGGFGESNSDVEIGRKAVDILKNHGFDPVWDQDPNRVIDLPPFEWQRRQGRN